MKELITMISIGSLSLSLLMLLAPKQEKTLKYVISVVFLSMVILPVLSIVPNFKNIEIEQENIDIKQNVLNINTAALKQTIAEILNKNDIKFKNIYVFANISEDFRITIKRVKIVSNQNQQKILNVLKELEFEKVVEKYEG